MCSPDVSVYFPVPVPAGAPALTTGPAFVEPDTLTVREPSLDDVLIALTGRHAEQEDQANAAEGEAP
jgi:hypothetical protein